MINRKDPCLRRDDLKLDSAGSFILVSPAPAGRDDRGGDRDRNSDQVMKSQSATF